MQENQKLPVPRRGTMAAVALAAVCLVATGKASAEIVTTRAALGARDSIDWGQLAFNGTFGTTVVTTALGKAAIVSSGDNSIWRLDQGFPPSGYWQANFTPGDALVLTWSDVIHLRFDDPVAGAGTQFATGWRYGALDAELTAFDSLGTQLEQHVLQGRLGPGFDGSAVFVGLVRHQADISRLDFRVRLVPENIYGGTTISRVDILPMAPVPEPGTALLWLLAMPMWMLSKARRSTV